MKDKKNKKYNHAYSVSFSFDSEIADGEEAIKQDFDNLRYALLRRARDLDAGEAEAFEHWDTYENTQ